MWLEVDFPTFLDALLIAEKHGHRIPAAEPRAFRFMAGEALDPAQVYLPIEERTLRLLALIEEGLYRGAYRYDLDVRRAFKWHHGDMPAIPLRRYDLHETMDVTVSYSSHGAAESARCLADALRARGLDVFEIDMDTMFADPLWRLRFREGLVHSRYFVPYVSEPCLGEGRDPCDAADIARMMLHHRSSEHFYPLLPRLSPDSEEDPEEHRWQDGESVADLDADPFGWILRNAPLLPPRWTTDEVAAFVASLVAAAERLEHHGRPRDLHYLEALRPFVSEVRDGAASGWARLGVRHPWCPERQFEFDLLRTGALRFDGVGDVPTDAATTGFDALLTALRGKETQVIETAKKE